MKNLVEQSVWDASYKNYKFNFNGSVPLQDILVKHVKKGESCFEIGCFPGNFLRFIHANKNAVVSGVDLTCELSKLKESFEQEGVNYECLIKGDAITVEAPKLFDVVMSFGFIEHFEDLRGILLVHDRFLKQGGTLILAVPNFTGLQYWLRKHLRSMTLQGHNCSVMYPDVISSELASIGYQTIESGYSGTAEYWCEKDLVPKGYRFINLGLTFLTRIVDRYIRIPNKYVSPYVFVVANKC